MRLDGDAKVADGPPILLASGLSQGDIADRAKGVKLDSATVGVTLLLVMPHAAVPCMAGEGCATVSIPIQPYPSRYAAPTGGATGAAWTAHQVLALFGRTARVRSRKRPCFTSACSTPPYHEPATPRPILTETTPPLTCPHCRKPTLRLVRRLSAAECTARDNSARSAVPALARALSATKDRSHRVQIRRPRPGPTMPIPIAAVRVDPADGSAAATRSRGKAGGHKA